MSGNHQSKKPFKKWGSKSTDSDKSGDKDRASEPFVLTFGQRAKWPQWAERMYDLAKYEFGPLGQTLQRDKYVELPLVNAGDYGVNDPDAETAKLNRQLMLTAAQSREKSMMSMYLDRLKLYSLIKRYLSQESISVVMRSEHFDIDADVDDPLKLWLAVKLTHRPGSDAVDDSCRRVECSTALYNCKQTVDEEIHRFYERWKYAHDTFVDAGNAALEDRDQANLFLNSVNSVVYGQVKADVANLVIRGQDSPGTLADMYHYVCRFVVVKKDVKSTYGAAFATLGEEFQSSKSRGGGGQQGGRGSGKQSKPENKSGASSKENGVKKGGAGKAKPQPKSKRDLSTIIWK